MLDFGKIIIYTSNLRIIRAPHRKPDALRQHTLPPVDLEGYTMSREKGTRRKAQAPSTQDSKEKEEEQIARTETEVMAHRQINISGVSVSPHPSSPLFVRLSQSFRHFIFCFLDNNTVESCCSHLKLFTEGCSYPAVSFM